MPKKSEVRDAKTMPFMCSLPTAAQCFGILNNDKSEGEWGEWESDVVWSDVVCVMCRCEMTQISNLYANISLEKKC